MRKHAPNTHLALAQQELWVVLADVGPHMHAHLEDMSKGLLTLAQSKARVVLWARGRRRRRVCCARCAQEAGRRVV